MKKTILAALAFAGAVAGAAPPLTGTLAVKNGSSSNETYSFEGKEKRVFAFHYFGVEIC